MNGIKKGVRIAGSIAGWAIVVKLASFIKGSFLIGSYASFFSATSLTVPLTGAFGGTITGSGLLLIRVLMHTLFFGTFSLRFLALCVPGFFASLYWSSYNWMTACALPLMCMALFIAHPVGGAAWIYSLYWLIPVGLYIFNCTSLFARSLGSTFVAHGVGSVIWAYTVPMTASAWLGLIPLVIVERLIFAVGMVGMHRVITLSVAFAHQKSKNFYAQKYSHTVSH